MKKFVLDSDNSWYLGANKKKLLPSYPVNKCIQCDVREIILIQNKIKCNESNVTIRNKFLLE